MEILKGRTALITGACGGLGTHIARRLAREGMSVVVSGRREDALAEYLHSRVGFSVVCPGFIAGDGMYQRMSEDGFTSNRMMSHTTTDKVTGQVIRAIRADLPELIETGSPVRPVFALYQLAPAFVERLAPRFGITELYRRVAFSRGRAA